MTETRRLDKAAMRQRGRELRALLNEWDPIGVMGSDAEAGDTEYDDLLWPLMRLLEQDATVTVLGDFLFRTLDKDYGLTPDRQDVSGIASRVKEWFDAHWAKTTA